MSDKFYYKDGSISKEYDFTKILHRIGGHAVERNDGSKAWYVNGSPHRIDGPAIEYSLGGKEWWIDGRQFYTEEQHAQVIEEVREMPLELRLTDPVWWVRQISSV